MKKKLKALHIIAIVVFCAILGLSIYGLVYGLIFHVEQPEASTYTKYVALSTISLVVSLICLVLIILFPTIIKDIDNYNNSNSTNNFSTPH